MLGDPGSSLSRGARGSLLALLVVALGSACSRSRAEAPARSPEAEEVKVGYATADRREVTKPVSSLTESDLDRVQVNHVEELLQGRVSGLYVTRLPNGDFSVRIRGTKTSGSGEPLVVVDGVPSMSLSRGLVGLTPNDVRRIDVLKGSAATMYGSRGANGVILITTKRGR